MALKQRVTSIKRMQSLAGLLKESFADRIQKQKEEGGMEEGFKDRIKAASAKEKEIAEPELKKLLPVCQKEAGKEYDVFAQKDMNGVGNLYVMPKNIGSGVIGRPVAAIVRAKSNGTVFVGITNGTVDRSGSIHMDGEKKFNVNDTENILDHIAMILSQVENYQ
jgi:hypothetical protein